MNASKRMYAKELGIIPASTPPPVKVQAIKASPKGPKPSSENYRGTKVKKYERTGGGCTKRSGMQRGK